MELHEKCQCVGCGELDNPEGPDCSCDQPSPIYDAKACGECSDKSKCDVPKHPENYRDYKELKTDKDWEQAAHEKYPKTFGTTNCKGIEIEPGVYSGCGGGDDCPVCGWKYRGFPDTFAAGYAQRYIDMQEAGLDEIMRKAEAYDKEIKNMQWVESALEIYEKYQDLINSIERHSDIFRKLREGQAMTCKQEKDLAEYLKQHVGENSLPVWSLVLGIKGILYESEVGVDGRARASEIAKGCVVTMKASSGLQGYGNPQCVSSVCEPLGVISLYGHNQNYKICDISKVLEYSCYCQQGRS